MTAEDPSPAIIPEDQRWLWASSVRVAFVGGKWVVRLDGQADAPPFDDEWTALEYADGLRRRLGWPPDPHRPLRTRLVTADEWDAITARDAWFQAVQDAYDDFLRGVSPAEAVWAALDGGIAEHH